MVEQKQFGITKNGDIISQFCLKNKNGLEIRCINLGCRLTNFFAPSPTGEVADILLGFDTLAEYENDTSFQGAFVGRYANRIKNASFILNNTTYSLPKNDGNNFLHGCYSRCVFDGEVIGENSVTFTYISPDGEDGFPGELWIAVTYSLSDQNEFIMRYEAIPSTDTHVNFTNHSYFNLAGEGTGSIENQLLWLNSLSFLETGEDLCPTGRVLDSMGGAFDFSSEKPIGRDIQANDPQLLLAGGYDHAFILEKDKENALTLSGYAKDPISGRGLRLYTTQPSIQLYTGNFLNDFAGKNGHVYNKRAGFCLETQHYPNSPNEPDFPSTLVLKGQKYRQTTVLQVIV